MSHNIFDIVLLRLILQGHLNHYITPHCVITNSVPGKNNYDMNRRMDSLDLRKNMDLDLCD